MRPSRPRRLGDHAPGRGGELHPPPGAVAREPVRHVHLLLEVVAEREVEEGPPGRRQLHRRRQPALHHRDVARGQLAVQIRHVAADLHPGGTGTDAGSIRGPHTTTIRSPGTRSAACG